MKIIFSLHFSKITIYETKHKISVINYYHLICNNIHKYGGLLTFNVESVSKLILNNEINSS